MAAPQTERLGVSALDHFFSQHGCREVTRDTVVNTGKKWKIEVPKIDMLANPEQSLHDLQSLIQPEPYVRLLNRLSIDRRCMDLIDEGWEVRVTFDSWVNKSLPRYQVTIYTDDEKEAWPTLYAPGIGIEGMLQHFFPWAEFTVDGDEHTEGAQGQYEAECYSYYESETGESFYNQDFDEWYDSPKGLVPVSENGETETYVLILSLNEIGKSFLVVDDYLADTDTQEAIGFELK